MNKILFTTDKHRKQKYNKIAELRSNDNREIN